METEPSYDNNIYIYISQEKIKKKKKKKNENANEREREMTFGDRGRLMILKVKKRVVISL